MQNSRTISGYLWFVFTPLIKPKIKHNYFQIISNIRRLWVEIEYFMLSIGTNGSFQFFIFPSQITSLFFDKSNHLLLQFQVSVLLKKLSNFLFHCLSCQLFRSHFYLVQSRTVHLTQKLNQVNCCPLA